MIPALRSFLRTRCPLLWLLAMRAAVLANRPLSRWRVRRMLRRPGPLLVELGAGDRRGENGWVTVDLTRHCDLLWDLRNGLPFPDGTVQMVYSCHMFEHLAFPDIQGLLRECHRVLAPGGKLSICVPNARPYIEGYLHPGTLGPKEAVFGHAPAYNGTTPMDYVNYVAYMGGDHKYMFDEENLLHLMRAAGFRNARLRPFAPELERTERPLSVFAEAEKQPRG
jgi:predicted SAM-dependent methyltransferase